MEFKTKDIVFVPLSEIKLNPKNRNKHDERQIEQFVKILRANGFRNPGIISKQSGLLVAGEGRYLALKKIGATNMPVMYQDFESPEQEYQVGISDNAIAAQAFLDLSTIHVDIQDMGPFDLDLLGIKNFQLEPNIEEINRGDENSEWVGMPDFEKGDNYIKLTYIFPSEEARAQFVAENNIEITFRKSNQWIVQK